jgi:hypothetical protein
VLGFRVRIRFGLEFLRFSVRVSFNVYGIVLVLG